ncbi:MAG: recombinase family protein, partial [Nanoarchaeota archaeon]|nr:recombinase family protein [Nanoarchaeota archaeon]
MEKTKKVSTIKQKRAAIYVRCSSEEAKKSAKFGDNKAGEKGYSPETQEKGVRNFINNNNYQLVENCIYHDIGCSGGTEKRPGLQQLLKDAKEKKFDIVVVYRQDRFFRDLRFLLNILKELNDLGVGVKSTTEEFADYSTPSGRAALQMFGTMAEWQRNITAESRNIGMLRAMKDGKWLGGTPSYGFKFNRETQKLEIDKEEADIVKMLYSWLVGERMSMYKVQDKINGMKIPTKYDRMGWSHKKKTGSKCWWNRETVKRILTNEIYTGVHCYRKYKHPARTKKKSDLRPKEDWISIEVPIIISKDLFKRTQNQLRKNKQMSPRKTKKIYAFQHKIICGLDNYKYSCESNGKGVKYYFCNGTRKALSPTKCISSAVSESRILMPVWNKLKQLLSNPEEIMKKLKEYRNQGSRSKDLCQQLEIIEKSLISCSRKKERYAELYTEDSIDKDFYDKKVNKCNKEVENFLEEKDKISQLLIDEEEKLKRIKSIKKLYGQMKDELENATY